MTEKRADYTVAKRRDLSTSPDISARDDLIIQVEAISSNQRDVIERLAQSVIEWSLASVRDRERVAELEAEVEEQKGIISRLMLLVDEKNKELARLREMSS